MLEFLLDLDPEDHLEGATWLLAFDYVALADYDAFDEVINDVSDKYPEKPLLTLWSEYRRHGSLPAGELRSGCATHFAPYYTEFTADEPSGRRRLPARHRKRAAHARRRRRASCGSKPKTSGRRSPASSTPCASPLTGARVPEGDSHCHAKSGPQPSHSLTDGFLRTARPCDQRSLLPCVRSAGRSSGGRSVRRSPARPASPAFRRLVRRCEWWARLPQRTQMACTLVTYSAVAISAGIGPNGFPV